MIKVWTILDCLLRRIYDGGLYLIDNNRVVLFFAMEMCVGIIFA